MSSDWEFISLISSLAFSVRENFRSAGCSKNKLFASLWLCVEIHLSCELQESKNKFQFAPRLDVKSICSWEGLLINYTEFVVLETQLFTFRADALRPASAKNKKKLKPLAVGEKKC